MGLLNDLKHQTLGQDMYEVLVVDNGSSDSTAAVVEDAGRQCKAIKLVLEPRLGLNRARNTGISQAQGTYVVFTEDECRVPESWLKSILTVAQEHEADIVGGPYDPWYPEPPPYWFKDEYAQGQRPATSGFLGENQYVSGANLTIRRSILDALGGFDEDLGMRGNRLALGEETEFILRARESYRPLRVFYDTSIAVRHAVNPSKFKLSNIARRRFVSGRDSRTVLTKNRRTEAVLVSAAKFLFTGVRLAARLSISPMRSRKKFPYFQQYVVERVFTDIHALGWHFAGLRRQQES